MPIVDFLGNFHPLLVHLPIGVLLVALVLVWSYLRKPGSIALRTLQVVILIGAISASLSSATGYILAQSGSYQEDILSSHQWLGIGLTFVSWCAFVLSTNRFAGNGRRLLSVTMLSVVLLFATGHAGGTLTHGAGFLRPPPIDTWFKAHDREPVVLDSNSLVSEAVHLVFSQKCISCHSATKQRGGLRLDAPEHLHKGGDSGPSLVSGNAEESLLMQRLLLPMEDEKHMPPEGRTQPASWEIDLIRWWVDEGASVDIRLADAGMPPGIMHALLSEKQHAPGHPFVPSTAPEPIDADIVLALRQQGAIVLPVSESESWLRVSLLNVQDSVMPEAVAQLSGIRSQVVWLACTGKTLTTDMMEQIGTLQNLRKVDLRRCRIEQGSLQHLSGLADLQAVNLSGATIGFDDIVAMEVPGLETLNLGLTGIGEQQLPALRDAYPKATIRVSSDSLPI